MLLNILIIVVDKSYKHFYRLTLYSGRFFMDSLYLLLIKLQMIWVLFGTFDKSTFWVQLM